MQTLTEIRELLAAAGAAPNRRLGQNFLIDGNLMRAVIDAAELDSARDVVLEVGAGTGSLTAMLAERAARVVAVETDKKLTPVLEEVLADRPTVAVFIRDVLAGKHAVAPEVMAAVADALDVVPGRPTSPGVGPRPAGAAPLTTGTAGRAPTVVPTGRDGLSVAPGETTKRVAVPGGRLKLVSNLPYAIATPLVMNLLLGEPRPALLAFTVQKEVADRFAAQPRTGDYGPVSLVVQAVGRVERLRDLSPNVFWPKPNVHSTLVRLRVDAARVAAVGDLDLFHRVAAGLFVHRRKTCLKSLEMAPDLRELRGRWPGLLAAAGIDPGDRGDTLTLEQVLALSRAAARG